MPDSTVIPNPAAAPASPRFSLEQANRALPYVSRVVADICESYDQIIELRRELENLDDGELRELTEREYDTSMDRLGGLVDELHLTGAELRDFEQGRVDFPAQVEGRDVMLTWQAGDLQIGHWHGLPGDDEALQPIGALTDHEAA
jgi:hypothetical protein